MSGSKDDTARGRRIAELNDAFRQTQTGGRTIMTLGVQALGPSLMANATAVLRQFTDFNADNDPHGEHDFGEFEVDGYRLFFKIDYYAPGLEYGSEDPTDPEKTVRVLTVMLPEEY